MGAITDPFQPIPAQTETILLTTSAASVALGQAPTLRQTREEIAQLDAAADPDEGALGEVMMEIYDPPWFRITCHLDEPWPAQGGLLHFTPGH